MIHLENVEISINGKKIEYDSKDSQFVSSRVIDVAVETYNPCDGMTLKQYANSLQNMLNEYRAEEELKRVNQIRKGRWIR